MSPGSSSIIGPIRGRDTGARVNVGVLKVRPIRSSLSLTNRGSGLRGVIVLNIPRYCSIGAALC